jgi:hypothetical protein
MDEPTSAELVLIACELAVKVESKPQREDGSEAAVYLSSGATLARRIKAGATWRVACNADPVDTGTLPAAYYWHVFMDVKAARRTNYTVWLHESPEQLKALWRVRKEAEALRRSLPHEQRKKAPWGPL